MFGLTVKAAMLFLRDALVQDSSLRSWAITHGGADATVKIQVGFNLNDPPKVGTGPVIFITPLPYNTGVRETFDSFAMAFMVGWIINDERVTETAATKNTAAYTSYEGVIAASELGDLIMAALYAKNTDKFEISDAMVIVEQTPAFPMIQGAARVEIKPKGPGNTPA